jgi:hypothetical protein
MTYSGHLKLLEHAFIAGPPKEPRLALLKELNAQIVSGMGNPAAHVNGAEQAPIHAHRTISARRSVGKRH